MQRIADDFTSIRQEMERIEAERGGVAAEAKNLPSDPPVFGVHWGIGDVMVNGKVQTYADWTDLTVFTSSADRYPHERVDWPKFPVPGADFTGTAQQYLDILNAEANAISFEVANTKLKNPLKRAEETKSLISWEICSDGTVTEVYQYPSGFKTTIRSYRGRVTETELTGYGR